MAIKCVKGTVFPLFPGTDFRCTEIIKCYYIYPSRVTIPLVRPLFIAERAAI
jgi:hypothetical protein